MPDLSRHYVSGDEIHAGDGARLAGLLGRVVFVLGFDEFLPEFVDGKQWYFDEYGHGFMWEQDGGGLVFQQESDEDFEFVSRGESHVASMRCSEPGHRVTVAIVAPRGPGRWGR